MQTKQSRFTLMLLAIAGVGILVLGISLSLLHRQNTVTAKLEKEYAQLQATLDENERKMLHLRDDIAELEELKIRLEQLDQNLTDYKYVPTYLRQIQDTMTRTNNVIKVITPNVPHPLNLADSPFAKNKGAEGEGGVVTAQATESAQKTATAKGPGYQVMKITLDMQGSYVNLVKLLDEFRLFRKMIYVRSIEFTPVRTSGNHKISARMDTYAIITPDQYKTQESQPASAEEGAGHEQKQ